MQRLKAYAMSPSYLLAEFGAYSNQVSRLQPDVGCWEAWRLLFKLYNLGLHRAYAYIFWFQAATCIDRHPGSGDLMKGKAEVSQNVQGSFCVYVCAR